MSAKRKNIQIKPIGKKAENKVKIILSDELTIYTIEDLKEKITSTVNKYDKIEITADSIKNMDLSFVQFINSIQKSSEKSGKLVTLNIHLNEENKALFDNSDVTRIIKK